MRTIAFLASTLCTLMLSAQSDLDTRLVVGNWTLAQFTDDGAITDLPKGRGSKPALELDKQGNIISDSGNNCGISNKTLGSYQINASDSTLTFNLTRNVNNKSGVSKIDKTIIYKITQCNLETLVLHNLNHPQSTPMPYLRKNSE